MEPAPNHYTTLLFLIRYQAVEMLKMENKNKKSTLPISLLYQPTFLLKFCWQYFPENRHFT